MTRVGLLALLPLAAAFFRSCAERDAAPARARRGMVLVRGGTFDMGSADDAADEAPMHAVEVTDFLLDATEVTNREFAAFVAATGHVTAAERDGGAWVYRKGADGFRFTQGADWRHPGGPESSVADVMDHPVVCVSWSDADAYARWAKKRLPTEAEWEYAARAGGGHVRAALTQEEWDDALGVVRANVWQGPWPLRNDLVDGFFGTAPAASYRPNALGLFDMIGNAWEWCGDWYGVGYYGVAPRRDPAGPESGERRVARGGSWFCSAGYCGAYSTHFRGASPPGRAFNNVGFRCAADLPADAREER
jgi:formylglycine-generating enzyme required for sulfatase activity